MTTTQFATLVGLLLGTVWVVVGFVAVVLVSFAAIVGAVVGAIIAGRIDVGDYIGRDRTSGDRSRDGVGSTRTG